MENEDAVKLALQTLGCSQKELALRLGVSPAKITKWKKGKHISHEMENKFRAILNIGDKNFSFVLWAGSLQEANQWEKLLHYLAGIAIFENLTGYDPYPLHDMEGLLCWQTFYVLREMGVDIPKKYPEELDITLLEKDDIEFWDSIEANPYSSLIHEIYNSLTDVYGFYEAYISDLLSNDDLIGTAAEDIRWCLMELAACKIEIDDGFAPKFMEFKNKVLNDYEEGVSLVKESAFRAGVPPRAELMDIVHGSNQWIRYKAELASF